MRITVLAMVVVMAACQPPNQPSPEQSSGLSNPSSNPATTPAGSDRLPDRWLGQWNGPEGTYILLSAKGDKYVVKIQSLDGPATYEGIAVRDHIEFQRDGKTESIHAGNGAETGMKWLLEEKNCLIVKIGEGFCRD